MFITKNNQGMTEYKIQKFPKSRIASIDVCEIGKGKHHIAAMIEVDVTESRSKVKLYKKDKGNISFTAWLVKVIGHTISENSIVAAYLKSSGKAILFNDINISFLVEKDINGYKVPIPLLISKANELSIENITDLLNDSKSGQLSENDIVLQKKSALTERMYYSFPGFIRRFVWRYMLKHPGIVFNKMGNVAVTSLTMMGKINGWFIPISIHPVCIGLGAVIKKPVVINDSIVIREIMNMTILIDHDVVDGAPMARFVKSLTVNIEKGLFLQ
jgi:pyruvate/2-oxoglutarate dehydrogenase complex dihydrolipoamide acyltransferase (E2) component